MNHFSFLSRKMQEEVNAELRGPPRQNGGTLPTCRAFSPAHSHLRSEASLRVPILNLPQMVHKQSFLRVML